MGNGVLTQSMAAISSGSHVTSMLEFDDRGGLAKPSLVRGTWGSVDMSPVLGADIDPRHDKLSFSHAVECTKEIAVHQVALLEDDLPLIIKSATGGRSHDSGED